VRKKSLEQSDLRELFHIPFHFNTLQKSSLFLDFQLAYPRYELKTLLLC